MEQPLPPNGACLLGSFNLTKYVEKYRIFDYDLFGADIRDVVRAMDNVIDRTIYPLPEQEAEAKGKRRMGLGITGLANALEYLGAPYGSDKFLHHQSLILQYLANEAYMTSSLLAIEKGAFPEYDEKYNESKFLEVLDETTRNSIKCSGVRNSHLLSIAPTGTISLCADNISSGIEPVFAHSFTRTVIDGGVAKDEVVQDYNFRTFKLKGKKASDCTVKEHLDVLTVAQKWVDSACSKTVNVGDDVTWDEFKEIYIDAWRRGLKGVTTFRAAGKRYGILREEKVEEEEGAKACYIDETTGQKECS